MFHALSTGEAPGRIISQKIPDAVDEGQRDSTVEKVVNILRLRLQKNDETSLIESE